MEFLYHMLYRYPSLLDHRPDSFVEINSSLLPSTPPLNPQPPFSAEYPSNIRGQPFNDERTASIIMGWFAGRRWKNNNK